MDEDQNDEDLMGWCDNKDCSQLGSSTTLLVEAGATISSALQNPDPIALVEEAVESASPHTLQMLGLSEEYAAALESGKGSRRWPSPSYLLQQKNLDRLLKQLGIAFQIIACAVKVEMVAENTKVLTIYAKMALLLRGVYVSKVGHIQSRRDCIETVGHALAVARPAVHGIVQQSVTSESQ